MKYYELIILPSLGFDNILFGIKIAVLDIHCV